MISKYSISPVVSMFRRPRCVSYIAQAHIDTCDFLHIFDGFATSVHTLFDQAI
jgi:hypothetical protein